MITDGLDINKMSTDEIMSFDISKFDDPQPDTTEVKVEVEEQQEEQNVEYDTVADVEVNDDEDHNNDDTSEEAEPSEESNDSDANMAATIKELMTDGVTLNGRKIIINDPSDIRTLIQKGLGANKRMQELKPQLKLLATLEEHGLANAESISYVIDLLAKKPEAISKLVKDSGIDPLDINDAQGDYTPVDRLISEAQFNLQEIMLEVQDNPKYQDTVSTVKGMDDVSRTMIGREPQLFANLVYDKESGVYDQIADIVTSEQAKGRYTNLGFLEAYTKVVDIIKEDLVRTSGRGETGHKDNITKYLNVNELDTSPHNNTGATSNRKGSSGSNKGNVSNTIGVGSATKAAMSAAKSGTPNGKRNTGSPVDINNLADLDILKMPLTAFD